MGNFDAVATRLARKPLRTITIPATAWRHDSPLRRDHDELVGLRLLSQADKESVRSEAMAYVQRALPDADRDVRVEAYNDRLVALLVGRSLCSPNDDCRDTLPFADDVAPRTFTSEFLRYAWEQCELLAVSCTPTAPMLDDARLGSLVERLRPETIAALQPPARRARLRRLLAFALEELEGLEPVSDPPTT